MVASGPTMTVKQVGTLSSEQDKNHQAQSTARGLVQMLVVVAEVGARVSHYRGSGGNHTGLVNVATATIGVVGSNALFVGSSPHRIHGHSHGRSASSPLSVC